MDVTSGRWVPAGICDPEKTEATVTGLEPGKKYEFRVKAVNEEGESEPLQTDGSILAKDPFGKILYIIITVRHKISINVNYYYQTRCSCCTWTS